MTAPQPHQPEDLISSSVLLVALGWLVGVIGLLLVGVFIEAADRSAVANCEGIGFGCIPDAPTTTLLVAFIHGLPTLMIGSAVTVVTWLATRRRTSNAFPLFVPGLVVLATGSVLLLTA